jgi:hypothetical protein
VVDVRHLAEPFQVSEAFADHFNSVYDKTASKFFPNSVTSFDDVSSDNLSFFPVTDADVRRGIRRLKPAKSVGLYSIPGLIIKDRTDILYFY